MECKSEIKINYFHPFFQIHKKLRTKALVLELLAAICLVKGGHDIILTAFDNFKREMNEMRRFETLMEYFVNPESFQVPISIKT
jgi:formic-like protein